MTGPLKWHSVSQPATRAYCQNGEHHLGDVESVTPVMVGHQAVVFAHAQQPPGQRDELDVEPLDQVEVDEHPDARFQRVFVRQPHVVEVVVV